MTEIRPLLCNLANVEPIQVWPEQLVNKHQVNKRQGIDLSGDWDTLGETVRDGYIYKAFLKRLNGSDWKDTLLYKRKYKKGERWLKKLKVWDQMLKDIVENGYVHRPIKDPIDNYMSILIGRNGHMFIYNGIHRFVCCLLSKVETKIPVKVLARHDEWSTFRNNCIAYQKRRGKLYAQLPHPDLEHIPYYWTNERAELIAENSLSQGGFVVDVGAHWGTTSSVLASKGFDCMAVEKSKSHFNRLYKISQFPNASFTAVLGDVTKSDLGGTIVMLNFAHHFTTSKVKLNQLIQFLERLSAKEIFYQAHRTDDKWAPFMLPSEMLSLIGLKSGLRQFKELKTFNGRTLYHLY